MVGLRQVASIPPENPSRERSWVNSTCYLHNVSFPYESSGNLGQTLYFIFSDQSYCRKNQFLFSTFIQWGRKVLREPSNMDQLTIYYDNFIFLAHFMLRLAQICSKDPLDRPTFRAVVPLAVFCSNQWNFKKVAVFNSEAYHSSCVLKLLCARSYLRCTLRRIVNCSRG